MPLKSRHGDASIVQDKLEITKYGDAGNKIVFLTFKVIQPDTSKEVYDFKLINKIITDGELKKNLFMQEPTIEPFSYYYSVSDNIKQKKELIKIPDPLTMSLEYAGDDGAFHKIRIKKDSGQLTVRFQLSANSKYISIYKPNPDLITLKEIYNASL